jgi:hypothetical protein
MHKEGTMVLRALVIATFAIGLASPAMAQQAGLLQPAPSVHVAVAGVASCAQLIRQLQAQGYTDIKISEDYPNVLDPRPEIRHGYSSPDDQDAKVTPYHYGWMGTALKDGRRVDVYVDRS